MALDLEKLKQKFSADKMKSLLSGKKAPEGAPVSKEENPLIVNAKQGFNDVKTVFEEGKYKLFVGQIVALALVFLLVKYASGKLVEHQNDLWKKMKAINMEELNKDDYLANKQHLLQLEPLFPDNNQRNEWFLRQMIDLLDSHNLPSNISGDISEDSSNSVYIVMLRPLNTEQTFKEVGKLISDIDNGDEFLRVSDITISKMTDSASLGKNKVTMTLGTVFPKEKYASKLFKDYAQQMVKLQQQKAAAAQPPAQPAAEQKPEAEQKAAEQKPAEGAK